MAAMEHKSSRRNSGWRSAFHINTKSPDLRPQPPKSTPSSHSVTSSRSATRSNSIASSRSITPEFDSFEQKYGRSCKMLSDEGAGGSILLVTRPQDNKIFAVKRFRRRQQCEDPANYSLRIAAEYYVGARLNHPNIIKTFDLFEERGTWLSVMEFAPYCLFDRVMSRRMSSEEINCAFFQILAGAHHLHHSGFAHRDLKLENVVFTENGIMKLIDFGEAVVCKAPGSRSANGVIGCRPYMAPEILINRPYDPQKADVWSLAIVFCCMALGRFPWKSADRSSEAFAMFAGLEPQRTPSSSRKSSSNSVTVINVNIVNDADQKSNVTEKVQGPWGLLQQLPEQSRDVIRVMLTSNAEKRPTMQQVTQMSWVVKASVCSEDADGKLHAIEGHQHK